MSACSILDVRGRCYSRELLELYDLSEVYEALPPLKQSSEIIGSVTPAAAQETGLVVGTPVALASLAHLALDNLVVGEPGSSHVLKNLAADSIRQPECR